MTQRTFKLEDQLRFAHLSGDYNPIHVDPSVARRMLFGGAVVHGVHLVLYCLDQFLQTTDSSEWVIDKLNVVFQKSVRVGECVSLRVVRSDLEETRGSFKAKLMVNGAMVTTVSATLAMRRNTDDEEFSSVLLDEATPEQTKARVVSPVDLETQSGELPLNWSPDLAAQLFPDAAGKLPAAQLAGLLCSTRLIGMVCPGLNSIFAELSLQRDSCEPRRFEYTVDRYDERFSLAMIGAKSPGLSGQLRAFVRPMQRTQRDYDSVCSEVPAGSFQGSRVLVIGGSRGLGEVASKILCAGGAQVLFTYHGGQQDAQDLVADIVGGGGQVTAERYDVTGDVPPTSLLPDPDWIPTHVLYFATPRIFSGSRGIFSETIFRGFCDYYVGGFQRIVAALYPLGTRHYYVPSSSAIDEQVPDMTEYIAAKSAAESASLVFSEQHSDIVIDQPRLPRLATDQTVTLSQSTEADPLPVLSEELQRFMK